MRQYAPKLADSGISYDRYRELVHYCRQYDELPQEHKWAIDKAAMVTAGEYYKDLVKNVTAKDMPYRYIDIPYSEAQFKRLRKKFFVNLHNIKNEREYHERMYGEWEKRKH